MKKTWAQVFLIIALAVVSTTALCPAVSGQVVDHWATQAEALAATNAPWYVPSARTRRTAPLGPGEVVAGIPEDAVVEMDLPDRAGGRGFVRVERGRKFVYERSTGKVLRMWDCQNRVYSVVAIPAPAQAAPPEREFMPPSLPPAPGGDSSASASATANLNVESPQAPQKTCQQQVFKKKLWEFCSDGSRTLVDDGSRDGGGGGFHLNLGGLAINSGNQSYDSRSSYRGDDYYHGGDRFSYEDRSRRYDNRSYRQGPGRSQPRYVEPRGGPGFNSLPATDRRGQPLRQGYGRGGRDYSAGQPQRYGDYQVPTRRGGFTYNDRSRGSSQYDRNRGGDAPGWR